MLKDLVSNAAILIASFTIMGQIFKKSPLYPDSLRATKIYWGIGYGALGIILMIFGIQVNPTTIADLRHLAIVIAAVFGGFLPAFLASVVIALGRAFLFGINNTAILAATGALLTGIICGWFSRLQINHILKAFFMNLIGLFIISIVFATNIKDLQVLKTVLQNHYLISLLGGFFGYHLAVYIANLNTTQRQLGESLIKLKESEDKLQKANDLLNRLSYIDGLTGIGNRRFFDETLEKEWTSSASAKLPLTLLMFDIDYFKKYNDTYGHLMGDQCLKTIADAIKEIVSKNPQYTFCRYGGEEFAIILASTNLQTGIQLATLIQQRVQSLEIPHISSEISNNVTLSIGLSYMIPNAATNSKEIINLADTALYQSKTIGRNIISTS